MTTLHIYHNQHLRAIINNFNNNDVIIVHNKVTIDLITHLFKINNIKILKLTYVTIKELLEGKLDNMKFDNIVTNPPYDESSNDTSKKLYVKIISKCVDLLSDNGVMFAITPSAILSPGSKNQAYKKIKDGIDIVDFRTNDDFNIGQSVISWRYSKSKKNEIKVIYHNSDIIVNNLHSVCPSHLQVSNSIINKLNYKLNNKKHLYINDTSNENGLRKNELKLVKDDEYCIEVICSSQKNPIQYTNSHNQNNNTKIIIPFSGGWKNGCILSNKPYSNSLFVNNSKSTYCINELNNIKLYLESKLISYTIIKYNELYPKASYAFLFLLSELDFSKKWSDKDLYKEFNISNDEILEIENWYNTQFIGKI